MTKATATIVADSISPLGVRITTFQLRYWRSIHSELMTHRVFSRNAGSSRARPSAKIIEQVVNEPWGPIHWGKNQPGMQASVVQTKPVQIPEHLNKSYLEYRVVVHGELREDIKDVTIWKVPPQDAWHFHAWLCGSMSGAFDTAGYHKQIVNRMTESVNYIDVLVTSTDYANWFALRDHPDAQPEIQELAQLMRIEYGVSFPKALQPGEWHLPYITDEDWKAAERHCQIGRITRDMPSYDEMLEVVRKISVARCARVSYKAFDGNVAPIEKDFERFEQLLVSQPLHASPAEHQATPDELMTVEREQHIDEEGATKHLGVEEEWVNKQYHGNLRGWIQFRKMLPNEFVPG